MISTQVNQTVSDLVVRLHYSLEAKSPKPLKDRIVLILQEIEKNFNLGSWKQLYLSLLDEPPSDSVNEKLSYGLSDLRTEVIWPKMEELAEEDPQQQQLQRLDIDLAKLLEEVVPFGWDVDTFTLENLCLNDEVNEILKLDLSKIDDFFEEVSAMLDAKEKEAMDLLIKKCEEIKKQLLALIKGRENQTEQIHKNTEHLISTGEALLNKMRNHLLHTQHMGQRLQEEQSQLQTICKEFSILLRKLQ